MKIAIGILIGVLVVVGVLVLLSGDTGFLFNQ